MNELHLFAGAGGVSSADSFSDIPQSVLSRLNLTAEMSCCKDSETECCLNSQSGTTLKHSTADLGAGLSTSYAEASPAKTSHAQAKAQDLREREAACGANSRELLAKYDPATHSWKTAQCSLLASLDEFSGTWPKWGMMRRGVCWELPTSERRISESASGFWPTPNCSGLDGGSNSRKANKKRGIHQMFYPTPTVCGMNNRKGASKTSGDGLATVVKKTWLTPAASEGLRSNFKLESFKPRKHSLGTLTEQVSLEMQAGGELTPQTREARLNPNWVEWLMGWPVGWTDLRLLEMDKFRSWLQQHLKF